MRNTRKDIRQKLQASLRDGVLMEYIMRQNLTVAEFAQKAGIVPGYVAELANGRRTTPTGTVRKKLMDATGMEFDTLFVIETVPLPERKASERQAA